MTTASPSAPSPTAPAEARARRRLAGWCLGIATTGIPATVVVLVLGDGVAVTAGTGAIGTITVAALGSARAFMRAREAEEATGPARR